MKSFQIVSAKTMDELKEELFKLNKNLDETKNDKFTKEIDTFSIMYNPNRCIFHLISQLFGRPSS